MFIIFENVRNRGVIKDNKMIRPRVAENKGVRFPQVE